MKHVDVTDANAGPIFLTYGARDAVDGLVADAVKKTPLYDFTADDGIGHTVWVVDDDPGEQIIRRFSEIDYLYVADGHHRSASAAGVANLRRQANPNHTGDEEYNFFLAVLFPHDQLRILDYNRVLKSLNGHTPEEMIQHLEGRFALEKIGATPTRPKQKGEIGMYFDKTWYKMIIKSDLVDYADPVNSLDIAFLQNQVLNPFFGISDPRTSDEVDFIGGIRGLEELVKLVDSGRFTVAFAMHPTSVDELMNIADAGKVMPPKSTWFEPKLRSGLLVHALD